MSGWQLEQAAPRQAGTNVLACLEECAWVPECSGAGIGRERLFGAGGQPACQTSGQGPQLGLTSAFVPGEEICYPEWTRKTLQGGLGTVSSLFRILRCLWRLCPQKARHFVISCPPARKVCIAIMTQTIRTVGHDEIYDEAWYTDRARVERGYEAIADSIVGVFHPLSMVDLGCGDGQLLNELRGRVPRLVGYELSGAALKRGRARGLDIRDCDLRAWTPNGGETYDLAVCMEVAEHLPPSSADRLVDTICTLAGSVVFTAATPGQGGLNHLNERPQAYWHNLFAQRNYKLDSTATCTLREKWESLSIPVWYHENLMVFRRNDFNNSRAE